MEVRKVYPEKFLSRIDLIDLHKSQSFMQCSLQSRGVITFNDCMDVEGEGDRGIT